MVRLFRQLSAIFVIASGLYGGLLVLHARPDLAQSLQTGAVTAKHQAIAVTEDFASWADVQTRTLKTRAAAWLEKKNVPPAKPKVAVVSTPVPQHAVTPPQITVPEKKKVAAAPSAPKMVALRRLAREQPALRPEIAEPQQPETSPPDENPPGAKEIASVEQRLRASLTAELLSNFDLFLYISEAEQGPWAQRMYVFDKQSSGGMTLLHAWPVSTGRDARVITKAGWRVAMNTPAGYYQLDPNRFHAHYTSMEWGMPMPYAMFFNWVHDGNQTGLAIHGASGEDLALLGTRASAGCIRLAPENAKTLFNLVREKYKGPVPRFAYDAKTGTMSNDGILWHNRNGDLRLTEGYRVLVLIENYGGQNVVAMLY